ncbi:MAG: plastocyanin/azurin family copper-binding protein [Candidatus Micrarchaeota archaeon]
MRKILFALVAVALLSTGCMELLDELTPKTTPGPVNYGIASPTPTVKVTPSPTPPPLKASVSIKNFKFNPQVITIKLGGTVTWTNNEGLEHVVASDPYPSSTILPKLVSQRLNQGDSFSFTFHETGSFGYHCRVHPEMKGTVKVVE